MTSNKSRPINEGYTRDVQKGDSKPNVNSTVKPTRAPPAPTPPPPPPPVKPT